MCLREVDIGGEEQNEGGEELNEHEGGEELTHSLSESTGSSEENEQHLEKLGLLIDLDLSAAKQCWIYFLKVTGLLKLNDSLTNGDIEYKKISSEIDRGMIQLE